MYSPVGLTNNRKPTDAQTGRLNINFTQYYAYKTRDSLVYILLLGGTTSVILKTAWSTGLLPLFLTHPHFNCISFEI